MERLPCPVPPPRHITTVGYGDLYPTTVQGRIIGIALMFVGISFVSLLAAAIASRFVKDDRSDEHHELVAMLQRIEADVAELKAARASSGGGSPTELGLPLQTTELPGERNHGEKCADDQKRCQMARTTTPASATITRASVRPLGARGDPRSQHVFNHLQQVVRVRADRERVVG